MDSTTMIGTGVALPGDPVPSDEIATRLGLSPEWARHFIGTRTRHLAVDLATGEQYETLETLGAAAVRQAVERAGVELHDLDFVVLATATPDELMPSTVNRIAVRLGITHVPTFQVQSGCAGAVQAFDLGRMLLGRPGMRTGVVIGGDVCVRHFETAPDLGAAAPTELVNYLLFGDGVGAAVLTSDDVPHGIRVLDVVHEMTAAGGTAGQVIRWYGQADLGDVDRAPALMEDYKAIERLVPELARQVLTDLLRRQGWDEDGLRYLLPPQLAGRITDAIAAGLGVPTATRVNCVADTGNCGNALPFLQLHAVFDDVKPGETLACVCIESSMWITGGIAFEGVTP